MDAKLKELMKVYGCETIPEFIMTVQPKGYDISSMFVEISELPRIPDKTKVSVNGYISDYEMVAYGKRLKKIKARLFKDGMRVYLHWIVSNAKSKAMLYSLEKNGPKDSYVQVSGKVSSFKSTFGERVIMIENPSVKVVPEGADGGGRGGMMIIPEPSYILRKKTTVYQIREAFRRIVKDLPEYQKEMMPVELETILGLGQLSKALRFMHGMVPIPREKYEDFLAYPEFSRRVNIEKIWKIVSSAYYAKDRKGEPTFDMKNHDWRHVGEIVRDLPFEMTVDQKRAVKGLIDSFAESSGTHNLVYGDVGSGKTAVAMVVARFLVEKGKQVAMITPSSVLSRQHYEEAKEFFGEGGVVFINSKTKQSERKRINKRLEAGEPLFVIGSISVNSLEFSKLSAVFLDEEQKLGVRAKEALYKKYGKRPNLVFMTATPIPRTLAASIFTNFNVFQIRQKPSNRKDRITKILKNLQDFEADRRAVAQRMKNGEQTLVIVPSISSNDMVNVKGTVEKYRKLFPEATINAIHGKMKKEEIDKMIDSYMEGEFDILVATVMVDSGFSNKRTSHVFVEGADRFGISQLHQIRGRCGRGENQGYCYLVPTKQMIKDETRQRLEFLTRTEDGFKLSEKDIELRGSGDLTSTSQSGHDVNFLDWIDEIEIMRSYLDEKESGN